MDLSVHPSVLPRSTALLSRSGLVTKITRKGWVCPPLIHGWSQGYHNHDRVAHICSSASSSGSNSEPGGEGITPPQPSSNTSKSKLYTFLLALHSVMAATLTFLPDKAIEVSLQVAATPLTAALTGLVAAQCWLTAACLLALKDAAAHDRLQSDTYKRLNLALLYWSVLVIATQLRHQVALTPAITGTWVMLAGLTAITAATTYASSQGGFSISVIARSLVENVKASFQPATAMSIPYSAICGLALLAFFQLFVVRELPYLQMDPGGLGRYLVQLEGAGMLVIGVVAYTLKDASDRGRLGAPTFRLLNMGLALACVVKVWHLVQIWVCGAPLYTQVFFAVMGMLALVVMYCDYQYFFAKR